MPVLEGIVVAIKIPIEMSSHVKTLIPKGFPSEITSRKQSIPNKKKLLNLPIKFERTFMHYRDGFPLVKVPLLLHNIQYSC